MDQTTRQAGELAPPTSRDILAISVPATLGYLTTPLVGLVDMTVVGRLGDASALGGVAIGAVVFDIVLSMLFFLRLATSGLTAQAFGRGDQDEIRAVLLRGLVMAAGFGLIVVVLTGLIVMAGAAAFGASAPVVAAMQTYLGIRLIGTPLTLANFVVFGWLLGLGRAGYGLLLQMILNGVNMALAVLLVLGLGWGVAGAAWSSVAAEAAALLAGFAVLRRVAGPRIWPVARRVFDRAAFAPLIQLNFDITVRTLVLSAAFAFFMRESARQGDVLLAANAVLEKLLLFVAYFLDGFAAAAETFVGQAVGARARKVYDEAVRLTALWGFVLAITMGLALYAAGGPIIALITTEPAVIAAAERYLHWPALAPVVGVLAWQMDGVFIGATWSRDIRNLMLLSFAIYIAAWAALMPILGNDGLWLALLIFFGARGLSLLAISRKRAAETFG